MSIDNRTCFSVNLRDGLRCRACARGPTQRATYHGGFGYHHVTPRSRGGPDTVQNLVLLCKACHHEHHTGRRTLSFDTQREPTPVPCHACGGAINPTTVSMNCGWYRCPSCEKRTHLFDHFGFVEGGDAWCLEADAHPAAAAERV